MNYLTVTTYICVVALVRLCACASAQLFNAQVFNIELLNVESRGSYA